MPLDQLDQFMDAIAGNESRGAADPTTVTNESTGAHGIFQIMPSNWAPWAKETFGYVAPKTAANQWQVARNKMSQYYNQFGDWDSVAIAWFAGPGAAQDYQNGDQSILNRSDGYSTVSEYLEKYRATMGQAGQGEFALDPYAGLDMTDIDPEELNQDPNQILLQVFDELTSQLAGGERVDLDDLELENLPQGLEPFDFARALAGDSVAGDSSAVQSIVGSLGQAGLYAALAKPGDLGVPEDAELDFDPGEVDLGNVDTENPDSPTGLSNTVVNLASKYLGVPYKWGGTNPNVGLDCSGFLQLVFKQVGVDLPRVSRDQANAGIAVNGLENAQVGDLISFGNPVHHIGMYVGNGKIIHAPRTGRNVSIDKIWENPSKITRVLGGVSNANRPGGSTTNVQYAPSSGGQGSGDQAAGTSGSPVFQQIANVSTGNNTGIPKPQVADSRFTDENNSGSGGVRPV